MGEADTSTGGAHFTEAKCGVGRRSGGVRVPSLTQRRRSTAHRRAGHRLPRYPRSDHHQLKGVTLEAASNPRPDGSKPTPVSDPPSTLRDTGARGSSAASKVSRRAGDDGAPRRPDELREDRRAPAASRGVARHREGPDVQDRRGRNGRERRLGRHRERESSEGLAYQSGWLVLPAFQGHGVATSATALVAERAMADGKYRFLNAYPSVVNVPLNAIYRKLASRSSA